MDQEHGARLCSGQPQRYTHWDAQFLPSAASEACMCCSRYTRILSGNSKLCVCMFHQGASSSASRACNTSYSICAVHLLTSFDSQSCPPLLAGSCYGPHACTSISCQSVPQKNTPSRTGTVTSPAYRKRGGLSTIAHAHSLSRVGGLLFCFYIYFICRTPSQSRRKMQTTRLLFLAPDMPQLTASVLCEQQTPLAESPIIKLEHRLS